MDKGTGQSCAARSAVAFAIAMSCMAGPSQAQTYIGAAALADISRFGTGGGGNGETFGGAVRVGTSVSDRWGVDLEFTRTGTLEEDNTFIRPLLGSVSSVNFGSGSFMYTGLGSIPTIGMVIPDFRFRTTTTQQFATLTAMPWISQPVGSRAEIIYLGGIAFVRTEREFRMNIGGRLPIFDGGGDGQEVITYSAGPAVGLDVRVSMTDRLQLVPGVRLVVVDESGRTGWLTRPSLGVQWSF